MSAEISSKEFELLVHDYLIKLAKELNELRLIMIY